MCVGSCVCGCVVVVSERVSVSNFGNFNRFRGFSHRISYAEKIMVDVTSDQTTNTDFAICLVTCDVALKCSHYIFSIIINKGS